MYYPNQRSLTIHRNNVEKASGKRYVCVYEENIIDAERNLSKSAFQVWLYLLCNKDKYCIEYSSAHISQITSISNESARKAFLEMMEKGYIVKKEEGNAFYDFYEVRKEEKKDYVIDESTGEIIHYKDIKLFKDEYLDGSIEEYVMSFKDLLEATDLEDALSYWRGENPYERL